MEYQGATYTGEVYNGVPNGLGTLTYTDKQSYVGEWKDGKQNGQGTLTFSDGEKYVGGFKDGKLWSGTFYDEYGNVEGTYTNGVWKAR